MKKLKKPTVGLLMATLVFSNMQLAPIYGNESKDIEESTNNQIVQNDEINIEYQNKSSKEDEIINIPDINLKKAINRNCGADENSDINRTQLENIEILNLNDSNIESLEGIQYCVNLKELHLYNNNISDISALSGLINLTSLELSNNNISDIISTLLGLTNLETLYLDANNISDISEISELINLKELHLDDNNISDISGLSELINLTTLSLDGNNISDISELSGLINLETLILGDNNISNISALSGLINLRGLYLYDNNISDISTLSKSINLIGLHLSNNNISDISGLSGLTNLGSLSLDGNNISDISALSGLINLDTLYLDDNNISDITPLLNLKNFWILNLSANFLDLNNSKTKEVIQHLQSICDELYYDNQYPNEFNDIKGHWAEVTIKSFTDKGFINGYGDNTFRPNNNMTRAEFVKVVNKVFGYTQKGKEEFTDVNENDWYYEDICIGIKEGYINGKSKEIFAPNDNITRQEVATILTNIMKNKDENLDKLNTFKDGNKTDKWAQSSVEGAIEAGYLNGYEDKTIRANENITRAEAISMLSRVKR